MTTYSIDESKQSFVSTRIIVLFLKSWEFRNFKDKMIENESVKLLVSELRILYCEDFCRWWKKTQVDQVPMTVKLPRPNWRKKVGGEFAHDTRLYFMANSDRLG